MKVTKIDAAEANLIAAIRLHLNAAAQKKLGLDALKKAERDPSLTMTITCDVKLLQKTPT